jgi:SAM-dependent methyltransferase
LTDNIDGPQGDYSKAIGGLQLPSGLITPAKRSSRTLRRRNALVANSFVLRGKRVLDVGCAEGLQSLYLSASADEVWGVDHRASEIDIARATAKALGAQNVRFECGDVRDPELFKKIGVFDLVIAWGFLHRISDVFALFYSLEPIARAISLEWRTPIVPMLSGLSIAFHPPGRRALDPMNTGRKADGSDTTPVSDADKVEGNSSFWEPTPGAVKAMLRRLGYVHSKVIGYDEELVNEQAIVKKWHEHLTQVDRGERKLTDLPRARVHMLFEKEAGSIEVAEMRSAESRVPKWDRAMRRRLEAFAAKSGSRAVINKQQHFRDQEQFARSVINGYLSGTKVGSTPQDGIKLSDIDFPSLKIVKYSSLQVARLMATEKQLPRAVFRDKEFFYKIWRSGYDLHRSVIVGRKKKRLDIRDGEGVERLPGFKLNFFDAAICPAFEGGIYHGSELVGYRMRAGSVLDDFDASASAERAFVSAVIQNTVRSGFVFRDLKPLNIIKLTDGRLSLIDLDTPLASLFQLSREIEIKSGAMGPHVIGSYYDFLNDFLAAEAPNELILEARRTHTAALPRGVVLTEW